MKQRDDWHHTDDIHYEAGRADPFAAAVRATRMAMVITDPSQHDNPIVFANEAFQKLTGYSRDEIIGHNCRFLQGPETNTNDIRKVRAAIVDGTPVDVELLNYRKDGSTFWNALYLSPVCDEDSVTRFFFASQLDVTDRVLAHQTIAKQKAEIEREVELRTAALQSALDTKTLLLHEVDHRVKNNLMMIGSLLRLQARAITDKSITSKLEAMLERVDALAAVHRRLYQSDDLTSFDVGGFAENLMSDVVAASGRANIAVRSQVDPIKVSSENASAFGLVLNEILTNAIKHAYPDGRVGTLVLKAQLLDGHALIEITDDGPGIDLKAPDNGLGRTLIRRLSKQVGATAEWLDNSPGTRVAVRFPVKH